MNPALQGYLAAMEESLAATDGLADAGSELAAVADLVDGNTQLTLAVNDGSVPVASRRALLDHLLEGKVRPEVRSLVHQAVTVVPAGELTASFHWLASRLTHVGGARSGPVGRAGSRRGARTDGLAQPGVGLCRRRLRDGDRRRARGDRGPALPLRPHGGGQPTAAGCSGRSRPARPRAPAGDRPAARVPRSCRPPSGWPPTRCAGGGPATSSPRSTPWSRTQPGPADGGWPGCRRPTRSTRPSARR